MYVQNGYITTDCDGYPQSYQFHNYSGSPEKGVRDMLRAGLDVDCAFGAGIALDIATVHSALRLGTITLDDVDTALRHLFMVRMRLGHFVSCAQLTNCRQFTNSCPLITPVLVPAPVYPSWLQ
jgi:beta-glucosidase-like glycosyl hydrolase